MVSVSFRIGVKVNTNPNNGIYGSNDMITLTLSLTCSPVQGLLLNFVFTGDIICLYSSPFYVGLTATAFCHSLLLKT